MKLLIFFKLSLKSSLFIIKSSNFTQQRFTVIFTFNIAMYFLSCDICSKFPNDKGFWWFPCCTVRNTNDCRILYPYMVNQ